MKNLKSELPKLQCWIAKMNASFHFVWIVLLLAIMAQDSSAQDTKVDSFLNILNTEKDDTSKVKTLNALSEHIYKTSHYEDARKYADSALFLAEKIDFKKGMAIAYCNNAIIYKNQGNYPEALKYFLTSLKIYQETGDKLGIGVTYADLGDTYELQGNYPEATKSFLAALKIAEEFGNKVGMAQCYHSLGSLNFEQGNYDEALKYFRDALKLREEMGDQWGLNAAYNMIGIVYEQNGNYPEALKNQFAALKLQQEIGDIQGIGITYVDIGQIYEDQGKYNDAVKNYTAALKIFEKIGDTYGIANCNNAIGTINIKLNNPSEANKYLNNALEIAKQIGTKDLIRVTYFSLASLDSMMGNYALALAHYKLFTNYKDSLLDESKNNQIAQMKEQYESEKKENEISLLNKEKALQSLDLKQQKLTKNYLIVSLFLVTVLSIFLYRNYRTSQQLKLQTIRNKIASDLHDDVGSTLSSISIFSQIAQQQSKEVIPMLDTIGESSRKMLDAMADIVWTINPENDQFEKIILRMRSFAYELLGAKQIEFRFVTDGNVANIKLSMEARRNLYLIFKEATNNMVKYAEATKASFSIKEEQGKLVMLIKDNGKGFDSTKETLGNGLKNMKKRATEMGGQLLIESIPGTGTTIRVELAA